MNEAESLQSPSPRLIPRRTGLFLAVIHNIPYLMTLPIMAVILGMHLGIQLTLGLCCGAFLLFWLFWRAYILDVRLAEAAHPHHRSWDGLDVVLGPFTLEMQKFGAWTFLLIFWLTATAINLIAIRMGTGSYNLDLFWLLYVPAVAWLSYKMEKWASESFAAAWLASAAVFTLVYLERAHWSLQWIVVSDLLSRLLWFLLLSVLIHYLFRRLMIFRCQSDFLHEIIGRLREERGYSEAFDTRPITSGPDEHLNRIAQAIGTKLLFERVFIHIRDPERNQLFMKGRYGADQTPWPETGWSIQNQESITGWVARNKKAHLCGDTHHCSLYFRDDQSAVCNSEAAVPILVENEVVGLIDIESSHRNAFDQSDIQFLWQVADSIGAALAYERHVSKEVQKAYQLMEDTALQMAFSRSLDEALDQVARQARKMFEADLVTIYKHAVSTWVPLPGLIVEGEAHFPEQLGNHIPNNARVNELLLRKDEIYIQPFADEDEVLLGANQGVCTPEEALALGHPYRFVKREGIKSTVYIKLGLGKEVVGSLFLNYRQRTHFKKGQVSALRAFAKVLALALILKRQLERANGPLAGAIPLSHSQAEAAFESASRKFNEIDLDALAHYSDGTVVRRQLGEFSQNLEKLKREWNNLILIEQSHLRGSSLAEPLTHLETKLQAMFPGVRLKWNSQDFVRVPMDEFGELLYKVIAEAVSNALVHAEASFIEVKSTRAENQFRLRMWNNGKPIEQGRADRLNALAREPFSLENLDKTTGIVPILLDARRWFGADWRFSQGDEGGTLITVHIPQGRRSIMQAEGISDATESEN